jgi:hypothetical protein
MTWEWDIGIRAGYNLGNWGVDNTLKISPEGWALWLRSWVWRINLYLAYLICLPRLLTMRKIIFHLVIHHYVLKAGVVRHPWRLANLQHPRSA